VVSCRSNGAAECKKGERLLLAALLIFVASLLLFPLFSLKATVGSQSSSV
jgi:hypothetical protein